MTDIWFWAVLFLYFTGAISAWLDSELVVWDALGILDKCIIIIGWPIIQFIGGIYMGWQILKEKWYY